MQSSDSAQRSEKMTAVAVGSSFGWLHHADGDRGVVMCAAMGYEALCAHHSWRVLADRFAAAGLPTLRFDYPGEGDSLGDDAALDDWRASIGAAIEWMRHSLGVREVALVGLRLGAALAAEVGGADLLVQLGPVVKGSAYLRELQAMSRMLAASRRTPGEAAGVDGEIDLEGFTLSPQRRDAIRAIDSKRLATSPAPRILIGHDPAARPPADYVAHLEALGAAVETRVLEHYRALTPTPLPAPAPLGDLDAIVAWTAAGASRKSIEQPRTGSLVDDSFVEWGVRFGPQGSLAGVLCEPRGTKPRATVLLLNTGANHHIGCGRSFVGYARSLARCGVASLRMDALGIGDSDRVEGGPRSVLYREERRADVSAALDFLAARGLKNVTLMGACSGASLAVYAALKDARVESLMLANIQVFARLEESVVEQMLDASFGATSTYVSKAMSARSWRRVLSGEVSLGKLFAIAGALVRRKSAAAVAALTGAMGSASPTAREAQADFAALSRRGVRILVLHGEHDVGIEQRDLCFGAGGRRLARLPGVSLEVVRGLDHSLSSAAARDAALLRLQSFLQAVGSDRDQASREKSRSLRGVTALVALGALSLMANLE